MDELINPERNKKADERLAQGIKDIPVRKFMEQYQYLEKDLLPRLEKKGGKTSADYKFFEGVAKSLMWSIIVCDRYDFLYGKFLNSKLDNVVLRDRVLLVERELEKYQALEDLFFTEGLDRIADGVKNRTADLLKRTKPT